MPNSRSANCMKPAAVSTGKSEGLQDGGDEQGPDRHGHAEEGHAGGPHVDDGGHVVDRAHHRRNADEGEPQQPERLGESRAGGRLLQVGQHGVNGPTGRGTAAVNEEARHEAGDRRPHEPVRQHIEDRKGHVVGPDHQRNAVITEGSRQNRNDDQEDHHRGVHGEEHRVELGGNLSPLVGKEQPADDRHVRPRERKLPPHRQGERPADHQHEHGRKQELDADDLMVGREDILPHETDFVMTGVRVGIDVTDGPQGWIQGCHENHLSQIKSRGPAVAGQRRFVICFACYFSVGLLAATADWSRRRRTVPVRAVSKRRRNRPAAGR